MTFLLLHAFAVFAKTESPPGDKPKLFGSFSLGVLARKDKKGGQSNPKPWSSHFPLNRPSESCFLWPDFMVPQLFCDIQDIVPRSIIEVTPEFWNLERLNTARAPDRVGSNPPVPRLLALTSHDVSCPGRPQNITCDTMWLWVSLDVGNPLFSQKFF